MADLREPPKPPGYYSSKGALRQYDADRQLYNQQETLRMQQNLHPLRDTTIGQMSQLLGTEPSTIAHPSQVEERTIPGYQSSVPSTRYVPTMSDTPQLRNVPGSAPSGVGKFETGVGPEVGPSTVRSVDPNQPSNLYQQLAGQQALERYGKWPSGMAGMRNFDNKVAQRAAAIMQENPGVDQASAMSRAQLEMTGGTTAEREAKVDRTYANTDWSRQSTEMMGRRQDEVEAMNAWRRDHGDRQMELATKRFHEGAQRGQATNELGWERLNSTRWYQDQMLRVYGDSNKSGRFSPEEQDALHQGNELLQKQETQDLNPQEMSIWQSIKQRLNIPEPPAYKFNPRPRVGPSGQPQGGVPNAPSSPGAFQGAPAGKQVGDILHEDGKPVAKWNGRQWQTTR